MAVQDAEAPRGHHQQARAGKEDAHERDGQLALRAVEAGGDDVDQQRRREHAEQHQHRGEQRQDREDGARHAARFFLFFARQQTGVNGNEGGREDAFAEQVLQEIGDAQRRAKGVGGRRKCRSNARKRVREPGRRCG